MDNEITEKMSYIQQWSVKDNIQYVQKEGWSGKLKKARK